ncbi:MAG: flavodoxin family protein [Selenomonadaceae bacterium]|nr:flavodoxin family protein [Selenomonadaceae bacterium]
MSRKIVVLNGSPRPKGNTSALVEEFARGAREAGCEVEIFFLDKMNIHGCKGCFGGGKNPDHPCVQRDDMEKIYPVYKAADVVVLATPLYYWNFSGQLRTAFDRLFAVAECDSNYANPKKESVLLMAAEGYGFDDALQYYQNLMKHLGWTERGHVLAGGVFKVGDIKGHKELNEAYELGKTVAQGNGL